MAIYEVWSRYWVAKCRCGAVRTTHSISGATLAEQFNENGEGVWGTDHKPGCPNECQPSSEMNWREVSRKEWKAAQK